MSQLKTNSITNIANSGDANIVLGSSGDTQVQSLNTGQLAGFRNQLINGDFRIWQRGTTVTPANGVYTADRWYSSNSNASSEVSRNGVTADGFDYACNLNADCGFLFQTIELQPRGGNISPGPYVVGSTWTLSIYSTLDLTSTNGNLLWRNDPQGSTVTEPLDSVNATSNWSLSPGSVADSNGFRRYEKTFVVNTAPPAGTLMVVANFGSLANAAVVGAQLEPGPVATPFEHRPIGTELALCQRYFFRSIYGTSGSRINVPFIMTVTSNGNARGCFIPPVPFRAVPTVTTGGPLADIMIAGAGKYQNLTSLTAVVSATDTYTGSIGIFVNHEGGTGTIGSYELCGLRFGSEVKHIDFDSEL
jgi:hypothetical protein